MGEASLCDFSKPGECVPVKTRYLLPNKKKKMYAGKVEGAVDKEGERNFHFSVKFCFKYSPERGNGDKKHHHVVESREEAVSNRFK